MRLTGWLMVAYFVLVSGRISRAEPPTAETLLAEYEKSVEKLSRVQIEWNRRNKEEAAGKPTDEYTLFRNGKQWKVNRYWPGWGDGRAGDSRFREQSLLVGEEVLFASQRAAAPGFQEGRPHVSCRRGERIADELFSSIGHCSVFFGRMSGDAGYPLWTVMREAGSLELLPKTEIVDGVDTYVLLSKGKYGEHKLWLDPTRGALPRRIEVHKYPGNLLGKEQLGTTPPPTVPPPRRTGSGPAYQECFCRIEKFEIENKGGAFIVAGFEHFSVNTVSTGKKLESRGQLKPSVLEVDPEFPDNAFRFDIDIPNGTTVWVREANENNFNGKYRWVDGKIVEAPGP